MKPYFAKDLPIEGEIKEGDIVQGQPDIHGNNPLFYHITEIDIAKNRARSIKGQALYLDQLKKVKLFLCSRDRIQIGDEYCTKTGKHICINISKGIGDNYFPKEMLVWCKGDNQINLWSPISECVKVIGEISSEAIWVKDGDEFNEYQVRRFTRVECFFENARSSDSQYETQTRITPTNIAYAPRENEEFLYETIQIKGQCGHFH